MPVFTGNCGNGRVCASVVGAGAWQTSRLFFTTPVLALVVGLGIGVDEARRPGSHAAMAMVVSRLPVGVVAIRGQPGAWKQARKSPRKGHWGACGNAQGASQGRSGTAQESWERLCGRAEGPVNDPWCASARYPRLPRGKGERWGDV